MKGKWFLVFSLVLFATFFSANISGGEGKPLVFDDFTRFAAEKSLELGTMTDGIHKWVKHIPEINGALGEDLIFGSSGRLYVGYGSGAPFCDTGVAVDDFKTKDGVIELKIGPSAMDGRTNGAYINYRAANMQSAGGAKTEDAYHVGIKLETDWSDTKDVFLFFGTTELASADVAEAINPQDNHTLAVSFEGNHHVVWFDGKKAMDFTDTVPERDREGYAGFGGYYSCGFFNEFALYKLEDYKGSAAVENKTTTSELTDSKKKVN